MTFAAGCVQQLPDNYAFWDRSGFRAAPHRVDQFPPGRRIARWTQGGGERISTGNARRQPSSVLASCSIGIGAHQRSHYHRLFRGIDRTGHACLEGIVGAAAIPVRLASVRIPALGPRITLGHQHAVQSAGRCEYSDCPLRQFEYRAPQGGVSRGFRRALWPSDAGDLGRSLQLLFSAAVLGGVAGRAAAAFAIAGIRVGPVFRTAAQLSAVRLASALFVR